MTPLAHEIAKQLALLPAKRGAFIRENSGLMREGLCDTHFFECTAIEPAIKELMQSFRRMGEESADRVFQNLAFLPAPKTWIEWRFTNCQRLALLLEENEDHTAARATLFSELNAEDNADVGASEIGMLSLTSSEFFRFGLHADNSPRYVFFPPAMRAAIDDHGHSLTVEKAIEWLLAHAHYCLVCINSPRIMGRKQHIPHAGLERSLRQTFGAGKFPLQGWTEILLKVSKPVEIDDGEPHEAHLTGRRALHFCRKHIRIRNGQLEHVSAHWRGDPALGIKQSRYTVAA